METTPFFREAAPQWIEILHQLISFSCISVAKTGIAAEQKVIISGEGILRSKTKPLPSAVSLYPFSQPICRGFAEQVSSCSTYSCGNGAHEEEKEGFTVPALPKQLTIIFKAELK